MSSGFSNMPPDSVSVGSVQPLTRLIPSARQRAIPGPRLLIAHDPYDPRCERIRGLRTELLLRSESDGKGEVIALLSLDIGDGRSQLAAELAIAFSQLGRPSLLIDADLRHPSQHKLFGADNSDGLSQAIDHGGTPCLQQVEGLRHLSLLTAGPTPDNPLELLLHRRFATLIDECRDKFDFVVVDTPPVTQSSDGLAVASLVRRVLVLSRARHTPLTQMRQMLRRLAAINARVVGAAINHF